MDNLITYQDVKSKLESPSLFRVQRGCNAGDTPLTRAGCVENMDAVDRFSLFLCTVWTLWTL